MGSTEAVCGVCVRSALIPVEDDAAIPRVLPPPISQLPTA
jgi:hypothetical protein